jgi:hypothetical protein
VNGFAVFIGTQIGAQIYGLAAKHTGYFWEGAAFHEAPPFTVNTSVDPSGKRSLSNTDHFWNLLFQQHLLAND